jgi:L,D-transpeptidase YcfS
MRALRIIFFALITLFVFFDFSFAESEFLIKIDLESRKLVLFENGREISSYPVAVPRNVPQKTPIIGKVVRVEKNPHWYPTEPTRIYYQKKKGVELSQSLKPGDSRNAMGKGKIIIFFQTPEINSAIRIHGTNDESSIGQRVTRGCIRMRNSDILSLIKTIEGKTTSVKIV